MVSVPYSINPIEWLWCPGPFPFMLGPYDLDGLNGLFALYGVLWKEIVLPSTMEKSVYLSRAVLGTLDLWAPVFCSSPLSRVKGCPNQTVRSCPNRPKFSSWTTLYMFSFFYILPLTFCSNSTQLYAFQNSDEAPDFWINSKIRIRLGQFKGSWAC